MAGLLTLPPSTVQSWKDSGFIPAKHQQLVLDKAREHGIDISPADFFARTDEGGSGETVAGEAPPAEDAAA